MPRIVEEAGLTEEDLYEQMAFDDNHKSFREVVDGKQPALEELSGLVDEGFARLCRDAAEAGHFLVSNRSFPH